MLSSGTALIRKFANNKKVPGSTPGQCNLIVNYVVGVSNSQYTAACDTYDDNSDAQTLHLAIQIPKLQFLRRNITSFNEVITMLAIVAVVILQYRS